MGNVWQFRELTNVGRLQELGAYLDLPEVLSSRSFPGLFAAVVRAQPSAVSAIDAPNPFPGILPEKRYRRLLVWPEHMDPWKVPVIWDAKPIPAQLVGDTNRRVCVLFLDGSVRLVPLEEVDRMVAEMGGETQ